MRYKLAAAFMTMTIASPVFAEDAVCYNCPPQWADWASMLEAIDKEIDIQMPHDNKNSGQTLSQLLAEREPIYAEAGVVVESNADYSIEDMARKVIAALSERPDILEIT